MTNPYSIEFAVIIFLLLLTLISSIGYITIYVKYKRKIIRGVGSININGKAKASLDIVACFHNGKIKRINVKKKIISDDAPKSFV